MLRVMGRSIVEQTFRVACCFLRNEDGVTAIEYALLAALIAIAIFVSVGLLGIQVGALYARISACVVNLACPP